MTATLDPRVLPEEGFSLPLVDLRLSVAEASAHLEDRLAAGDVLNAFLLAAALRQVAEDELEREWLPFAEVRTSAEGSGGASTARRAVARAAGIGGEASAVARRLARTRRDAAVHRADAVLADLVDALADGVMRTGAETLARASTLRAGGGQAAVSGDADTVLSTAEADTVFSGHDELAFGADLRAVLSALAAEATPRLPSSFQGFDQHPDDLRRLVARLPRSDRPTVVVGLRTSGSTLAPLIAAELRHRGDAATAITVRPSVALSPAKRAVLKGALASGGRVLVTDDPPASGASLARVVRAIGRWAPRPDAVVLLLALFGDDLPPALTGVPAVTLPWRSWSIHDRLAPEAVRETLTYLWPHRQIAGVTTLRLHDTPDRGHCHGRYRVELAGDRPVEVLARGAGLGFYGDHALAVAGALGRHVPAVHGVVDGVVLSDVPAEGTLLDPPELSADDVAAYVAARRRALAIPVDRTGALRGEDPVWEVASTVLSRSYGRAWRPVRVLALDRALRRLLQADEPSVVDGHMGPGAWGRAAGGVVKAAADERAFSNRNLASCDPAYDAAAAAVLLGLDPAPLRAAAGDVPEHRWLANALVALWAARRDGALTSEETRRRSARAVQRSVAALLLDDVTRRGDAAGPLCALDVDGVLEDSALGWPSLTPASALALRALFAHGYRPVIATGRAIGEVAERCAAYGLAAGVAEYGAALWIDGRAISLVDEASAAAVERVRTVLAARPGVEVGASHEHTIRAWRRDARGNRRGLDADDLAAALRAALDRPLRPVLGDDQTDLVPAGIDKASGLSALIAMLDATTGSGTVRAASRLAFACGDSTEDACMLRLADRAAVPHHAAKVAKLVPGARVAKRPHQAGLAEAVGELIGHKPGGCPRCAAPTLGAGDALLMEVLGAREAGPGGMAGSALKLVVKERLHGRR